jgi:hypothetical protein
MGSVKNKVPTTGTCQSPRLHVALSTSVSSSVSLGAKGTIVTEKVLSVEKPTSWDFSNDNENVGVDGDEVDTGIDVGENHKHPVQKKNKWPLIHRGWKKYGMVKI